MVRGYYCLQNANSGEVRRTDHGIFLKLQVSSGIFHPFYNNRKLMEGVQFKLES